MKKDPKGAEKAPIYIRLLIMPALLNISIAHSFAKHRYQE
jgi:hypothetical protein